MLSTTKTLPIHYISMTELFNHSFTKGSRTKSPWTKSTLGQNPTDKIPQDKIPPLYPPNCSIAQYFLLYIMLCSKASFLPPLLDVIYSMVIKWRSVAEGSSWSKCVCSQDLSSESDCLPPLPLFYMDSETMRDRNVRCLSLIGCYRLRVHWGSHWLEKFGAKFWRDFLAKQWEIEIYTRRSSFAFDTRKVNTGFIWQWILTILTTFYGGYFSRFYKKLIKGYTN